MENLATITDERKEAPCQFHNAEYDPCRVCNCADGEVGPWDYVRHAIGLGAPPAKAASAFARKFVLPELRALRDQLDAAIGCLSTLERCAPTVAEWERIDRLPPHLNQVVYAMLALHGDDVEGVGLVEDLPNWGYALAWLRLAESSVGVNPGEAFAELERAAQEWGPRMIAEVAR